MPKIKNRYQAESMFCDLFFEVGQALGVPEYGEACNSDGGVHQLSSSTIGVIHECEFQDPHFIGGPGAFNHVMSSADVERIFARAESVAVELCMALKQVHPARAQHFRARLDEIKAWMLRTSG